MWTLVLSILWLLYAVVTFITYRVDKRKIVLVQSGIQLALAIVYMIYFLN